MQVAATRRGERLRDAPARHRDDHQLTVRDVLLDDREGHRGEPEPGEERRVQRALLELERVVRVDMRAQGVGGERLGRAAALVGEMAMVHEVAGRGAARGQRMVGRHDRHQLGVLEHDHLDAGHAH